MKFVCLQRKGLFIGNQHMFDRLFYHTLKDTVKKPDVARDRIVELIGDVPRIELFARQTTPGWDVWGNEIQSDIEMKDEEEIE